MNSKKQHILRQPYCDEHLAIQMTDDVSHSLARLVEDTRAHTHIYIYIYQCQDISINRYVFFFSYIELVNAHEDTHTYTHTYIYIYIYMHPVAAEPMYVELRRCERHCVGGRDVSQAEPCYAV